MKNFKRVLSWMLLLAMLVGFIPMLDQHVHAASSTSAVGELLDSYTANSSTFTLANGSRIYVVASEVPTGDLLQVAQLIQSQYAADGRPSSTVMPLAWGPADGIASGDIALVLNTASGIAADGYQLSVTTSATVTASNVRGLIYGSNMIMKHLRYADSNSIQGFTAADTPDTVDRVVSLDCGRKYYTKEWICNFIREMSWMGYNALQLHFSDDSGFRFDLWDEEYYVEGSYEPANDFSWLCGSEYTSWTLSDYQADPDKGKFLSTAEVIEILETAKAYHIEVIPSYDSPAHLDYTTWKFEQNYNDNPDYSFFSTYDNKTYYAKDIDGIINYSNTSGWSTALKWPYYAAVDVLKPQAKAFIYEIYNDVADFFKYYAGSTDFSVGADEVNLSAVDVTWGYSDFVDYINELNALLNDKGYTMRMYNDFLGSTTYGASSYDYASNIEIQYWDSPFNPSASSNSNHTEPVSYYVDEGRVLYNCIQTNTYYALRITSGGSDARSESNRQWTFYHATEELIYDEWYSADISEHGDYSEDVADVPAANLGGAYFLIWGDYACVSTEQEIWNGVYDKTSLNTGEFYSLRDRMWSNIIKQWNWDINDTVTFDEYAEIRDAYGNFPGCGSSSVACSQQTVLPTPTDIFCAHQYASETIDASCVEYEKVRYTCSVCGDSYVTFSDAAMSDWQDTKPEGVDESLIESKTVYRYSDYETVTNTSAALDGYTMVSSTWVKKSSGSVQYVSTWPSGFSTSNSLYTKYNNKSKKVTASETATTKRVIDSDAISGYLWYHWCRSTSSEYTSSTYSSTYPNFHAFYASSFAYSSYDSSDGSYKVSDGTTCSRSNWYWYIPVYTQKYTDYTKQYTHGRWSDYSDWSDTAATASDTRKVEAKTVYRYAVDGLAAHTWENGICTVCSAACTHTYQNNVCTECGLSKPVKEYYLFGYINGADYGSESDSENIGQYLFVDGQVVVTFSQDSYVGVKSGDNADWYMTDGWQGFVSSVTLYNTTTLETADKLYVPGETQVTFTLVDNGDDTYTLSYVAVACDHEKHSTEGVCSVCGATVEHTYVDGSCSCGLLCEHEMADGFCTICGAECDHTYQNNLCTICGREKPVQDYYLFGWINGANYACEEDYANLGEYVFVDGQLTVFFTVDSYVGVKAADNEHWYMTNGWQGFVSTCTLYNTETLGTTADKLYVPADTAVTFTLVDNGDDTYTLSYITEDCTHKKHTTEGKCSVCGEAVEHVFSQGFCSCGLACAHTYVDSVCTICGWACTHTYQSNVCVDCGFEKVIQDMYLFGYINGADYGVEDDYLNVGEYLFVDGKLVVCFTTDSYVGVKTADCLNWYMTDGYQEGATSVTLYHSEAIENDDKLLIPGQHIVTLTLVDNGNDTYTLSFEALACPHESHSTEGICGLCGGVVEHGFADGFCSCGLACSHTYSDGVCTICGQACEHNWLSGQCQICGMFCDHEWVDGMCQICGKACAHTWQDGVCTVCAQVCGHSWADGKCSICGVSCAHTYQNNICTNCGYNKPAVEYYLFGSINGEQYGYEEDLGQYLFSDGSLTATFRQEGYVGLRASDGKSFYFTEGDLGQVSSAVLYNASAVADGQLLYVPGCMVVTFTLVDNGDDTLTLSYTAVPCAHESHGTDGACTACGTEVSHTAVTDKAVGATCIATGLTEGSHCEVCGLVLVAQQATGLIDHNYERYIHDATCMEYGSYEFICSMCGDSYIYHAEDLADWMTQIPDGMDESLFEVKTEYRYSDYETTTSYETSLDGWTVISDEWIQSNTGYVDYVDDWTGNMGNGSDIPTDDTLYITYNNKDSTVTASETATTKRVITSRDTKIAGYIWYHWCYYSGGSAYTANILDHENANIGYDTLWAFYSDAIKPSDLTTATDRTEIDHGTDLPYYVISDDSDGCTSAHDGYWYIPVYRLTYADYNKQFTYGRWTDYTDWSDTAVTASDTRQVETRTLYRLKDVALGEHSYETVVTDPTCTAGGYSTHTCAVCGDSYVDAQVDALGHTEVTDKALDATCSTTGLTEGSHCETCGEILVAQQTIPTTSHNYIDATCTSPAICLGCGSTAGEALGHTPVVDEGKEATCTDSGLTEGSHCETCGEVLVEQTVINALGHTPVVDEGKDATCTDSGLTEGSHCETCGEVLVEQTVIDALGHTPVVDEGKEATCTDSGLTEGCHCETCGEVLVEQTVIDALGHTPVVDEGKDATCTDSGLTEGSHCEVCGEVLVEQTVIDALGHSFVNGKCETCGEADPDYVEPVVTPALELDKATMSLEDMVIYNIYFNASNLDSVVEMGLVTYETILGEKVSGTISQYTLMSDGSYMVSTEGIPAKNMGDAIFFRAYAKLSDGSYVYSEIQGYSAKGYALSILNSSASPEELKDLAVALLNYGAQAQTYFGHNADSLMNASLTAEHQARIEPYSDALISNPVLADSAKVGAFAATGGWGNPEPSISLEGAFHINYYFYPSYEPVDGVTLYCWTDEAYNEAQVLTAGNATDIKQMEATGAEDEWLGIVTGIAAKELESTIYVAAVYECDGVTYCSGVIAYSVARYCKSQVSQATDVADLAAATAVYGYYAKQYFATIE